MSVSIVWIDMLPTDNADAARRIASTITDPRVRQFHDPKATHLAGKAFAKGMIRDGAGPAWDIYLFYDKDSAWEEAPPKPVEWWHQLGGGGRADPKRFAAGTLIQKLHDSVHKLTGKECEP